MKKILLTTSLFLLSIISFSQDIDVILTDSISSKDGKTISKYEFYYDKESFTYGESKQAVSEFTYDRVVSITESNECMIYSLKSGVFALVDKKSNTVTLLFNSGAVYKFYN